MPENPLLPNFKLQRLYTSMLRCRDGSKGQEAIYATLAEHLESGDTAVAGHSAKVLASLLVPATRGSGSATLFTPETDEFAFACGLAAGAQLGRKSRLVAAILSLAHAAHWPKLLEYSQRARLPLILICTTSVAAKPQSAEKALSWSSVDREARKLRFPTLTIDGADAVAMYRAVQESALRARHGDGPALLWCLMPGRRGLSLGHTPAERLREYMTARSIRVPQSRP